MKRPTDALGIIPIPSAQTFPQAGPRRPAPILRERDEIEVGFAAPASGFPLPFEVVCKIAEYVIHPPASENARYRLRELINLQRVCKQLHQVSHTLMKETQEGWKYLAVLRDQSIVTSLHPDFGGCEELLMQRWGMNRESAMDELSALGKQGAHEVSNLNEQLAPAVKKLRVKLFDSKGIDASVWLQQAMQVEELFIDSLRADPAKLLLGLAPQLRHLSLKNGTHEGIRKLDEVYARMDTEKVVRICLFPIPATVNAMTCFANTLKGFGKLKALVLAIGGLDRCQDAADLQWIEGLGKWLKQHPLLEKLQIFSWSQQLHGTQKDELVKALTNFAREHRSIYEIGIYEPGRSLPADEGLRKALAENACYAPKS